MGNLCCLSSKRSKKYLQKPSDPSAADKSAVQNSTPRCKRGGKSNRLSEIDYYYDDYEDECSNAHLAGKHKSKPKQSSQQVRSRKQSNKSALSYYATDLRLHDKYLLNSTQTTLLNTAGLDAAPCQQAVSLNEAARDNSKIINHLNQNKFAAANTHLLTQKDLKQANLIHSAKLNQILIPNPNLNHTSRHLKYLFWKFFFKIIFDEGKQEASCNSMNDDLCSSSASSILASSSMSAGSSTQSNPMQNQSMTAIDHGRLLKNIIEYDDCESTPNLLLTKCRSSIDCLWIWQFIKCFCFQTASADGDSKGRNARKLSHRTRGSYLNHSLNETDLTRSYVGRHLMSDELNEEPTHNKLEKQASLDTVSYFFNTVNQNDQTLKLLLIVRIQWRVWIGRIIDRCKSPSCP